MQSFRHYAAHHNDQRIMQLMYEKGAAGYGVYWIVRERIASSRMNSISFADLPEIAEKDKVVITLLQDVINIVINEGLLETDGTNIWSEEKKRSPNKLYVRLYSVDVKLWYKIRRIVFERDNFTCTYCGQRGGKLEADHVMPISRGGSNELDNLTTACRRCNRQKKDRTPAEFYMWQQGAEQHE